jgi:hypothetical protein
MDLCPPGIKIVEKEKKTKRQVKKTKYQSDTEWRERKGFR